MWSGRLADAEAVCHEVLARTHDRNMDATLRLCLVQTLLGRGRIEEALQEADAAIASRQLPDPKPVRLQAFKASALASLGQLGAAAETAAWTRPAAEELGDALAECIGVATLHWSPTWGATSLGRWSWLLKRCAWPTGALA